jgi:hypothetical protein
MWPGAVHELNRALAADSAVGSFFVVVSTPSLAFSAGVVEGEEPGRVRHSARTLPLKDSANALSVGLPGRLTQRAARSSQIQCENAHRSRSRETNSGPMPTLIVRG